MHLLRLLFPVKEIVSPTATRTEQHSWRHPRWKILRRFWCEDNNAALTHMQPHYYRLRAAGGTLSPIRVKQPGARPE